MEDGELLVQMNGLRPTLVSSVTLSDTLLVEPLYYLCMLTRLNHLFTQKKNSTGLSIPMAPSKPLYYHSVQCSSQHLSLVECGFMRHTDLTKTYPNAVIKCQERKYFDSMYFPL